MKTALGVLIALAIGAGCRWFNIPVPAPPTLIGALLVLAVTVGYIGADRLIARMSPGEQMSGAEGPGVSSSGSAGDAGQGDAERESRRGGEG